MRTLSADGGPGDTLGPQERLDFEHLLQWLRLSFLLTPLLVLVAFGAAAEGYAVAITVAVAASFTWVGLLARYRPRLLLRVQLWLRVLDCGLVYLVLVNYHAFLRNAYYDTVYVLFVVAAAATHGRRGAFALSGVAGLAVLLGRLQLMASGALANETRHFTDAAFYTLFFLVTSSAVAFLMHKTASGVLRREEEWRAEISARNAELERAARELSEAVHLREAMLTGVTHDLRTPLTVIKAQAQVLKRRADERLWPGIEQIDRAATRMARWIDELLEAAVVQKVEDLPIAPRPTDLVKLARGLVEEHAQATRGRDLLLHAEPESIVGMFDAPRLERVLDNLIGNALKYSPRGSEVTIDLASRDSWATIVVHDEGIGIPSDDLPHIFEPFRRGANVVGQVSGTGIGLASSLRIVQAHGGTISVESTLDAGSTFTVRLPLDSPMAGAQE